MPDGKLAVKWEGNKDFIVIDDEKIAKYLIHSIIQAA